MRRAEAGLSPGLVDIAPLFTDAPLQADRLIPNRVYQTWKSRWLDPPHAAMLTAFRKANPQFGFHFFDDDGLAGYMDGHWGDHPICDIFHRTRIAAAKADIWRYCILHERGGVYLDIDSTLRFALDLLPKGVAEVVSFEKNPLRGQLDPAEYPADAWFIEREPEMTSRLPHADRVVLNWCLLFAPAHPILADAIAQIVAHAESFRGKTHPDMLKAITHFSGPLVLTRAVWNHLVQGRPMAQMGIDFSGAGVFKAASLSGVYHGTPHYTRADNQVLLD